MTTLPPQDLSGTLKLIMDQLFPASNSESSSTSQPDPNLPTSPEKVATPETDAITVDEAPGDADNVPLQSFTTEQLQLAIFHGLGPLGPFQKTLAEQYKRMHFWMYWQNIMRYYNRYPPMTRELALKILNNPLPQNFILNTKKVADDTRSWLETNNVRRKEFGERILNRNDRQVYNDLNRPTAWSQMVSRHGVYIRMFNWLRVKEDVKKQIWAAMKVQRQPLSN
ncbi:unnamed protein product [Caenorhabditis brenneri]